MKRPHTAAVTLIKFVIMILCYQLVIASVPHHQPQAPMPLPQTAALPPPPAHSSILSPPLGDQHPLSKAHLHHLHQHQQQQLAATLPTSAAASLASNSQPATAGAGTSPPGASNSASLAASSKKGSQAWQTQNLNKFQKYLSEHQQELVRKNPGSLWAVARAIKMAIKECQYQMRHEPWDCPIYGFSVKPAETFGLLMSRSIKETSFIQSLLSSAIAHSVARACTESIITTCSRKQLPHGNGFGENIEFGLEFARNFTEVTHELLKQQQQQQHHQQQQVHLAGASEFTNHKGPPASLNSIGAPIGATISNSNNNNIEQNHLLRVTSGAGTGGSSGLSLSNREPIWKEKRLRQMINLHNEEVGKLIVLNYMRRECKCHGLSGTCTMQTCWDKLPPFRDVANRLHDSLDKALRVEMYVAPQASSLAANRHKSLTSATAVKKSNKKRSSSLQSANLLSGLGRSSTPAAGTTFSATPLVGDSSIDNGSNSVVVVGATTGTGRLQAHQERTMNSISINNNIVGGTGGSVNELGGIDKQLPLEFAQNTIQYASLLSPEQSQSNTTSVKRRPIARSIGLTASTITPGKLDLLYAEESPDFCIPSERYNIKGTKGRICSESPTAANSCETLCCGRGYKTEIREEKYTCECKFQYCCNLKCNTCTRRKTIHKCL